MTSTFDSQADSEQRRLDECVLEPIRIPGSIQPHGALLTLEPSTLTIVHASENLAEILGVAEGTVVGRPLAELTGAAWTTTHAAALSGRVAARSPIALLLNGTHFETVVHRGGPLVIVEFEPLPEGSDDRSEVAIYGAMHRLARLRAHDELWSATARELCELTGFERATIYSFHPDGHGEIVAEILPDGDEPYLGLRFPASDIPAQARELYLTKLSRQIVDNSGAASRLVALPPEDGEEREPLDLSEAELRSVSPHHLQFMRNMGQASTLSLSLVRDDRLMGMVTLAHSTPHRVSYILRQGLQVLANQVALQLSAMDEIDRLTSQMHARSIRAQLVGQAGVRESSDAAGLAAALFDGELSVLTLVPASGAVLSLAGATHSVGVVPEDNPTGALREWARTAEIAGSFASSALPTEHPELAAQLPGVTGLLFVPLPGSGDFLAWFRPEITEDVHWLGAQTAANRVTPLSPRTSFSSWTESVSGRSAPWGGLENEAEELSRDLAGALIRHAEAKLASLAMRDPLTGLPNRRLFMERLDRALRESAPGATSLLFIDLDSFKGVNDTYGHDAGDQVLVEAAARITLSVRSEDTVARLGGDEFVVLCERATIDDAAAVAQRIVEAVSAPMEVRGTPLIVTASVGIADAAAASTADALLQSADVAMYRAKNSGRNQASH
jgi:chemotaxis family two-component system sensor kinase Cph1